MAAAKKQIQQLISGNNINSVAYGYNPPARKRIAIPFITKGHPTAIP